MRAKALKHKKHIILMLTTCRIEHFRFQMMRDNSAKEQLNKFAKVQV